MVAECKPMSQEKLFPSHSPAKTPSGGFSELLRQKNIMSEESSKLPPQRESVVPQTSLQMQA